MQQLEFDFVREFYGEGDPADMPYAEARVFLFKWPSYNVYVKDAERGRFVMFYFMDMSSFDSLCRSGQDVYLLKSGEQFVPIDRMLRTKAAYRVVR